MIEKERILSKELFEKIISDVMEAPQSPYKCMMKRTDDIDIDFFEDITRDEDILDSRLCPKLKENVVHTFQTMANELLVESDLEQKILRELYWRTDSLKALKGEDIARQELDKVASLLREYASQRLQFISTPPFTEAELEEKYNKAKEITIIEKILRNNEADVIDFHHALQAKTVWECQKAIEEKTSEFLIKLAEKV